MAQPFGKAQAHFIALGQAPERDIIATRALFLGSLIGSLVNERHSGGIFIGFKKRISGDKDERHEKQNGMQPSGSYCYHPASPLARFSTHTYHPAQARAFVILSLGDFWAINHGQKQSHRNICSKVSPFRAFSPRGHLCDLPDNFLLSRLFFLSGN